MTRYIHSPSLKALLFGRGSTLLEHTCPRFSQQITATSLDRARWSGLCFSVAMASQSPDLTPCDFFLWVYVKDKVYVPPMSTTLQALQECITAAVTDIDGNMLLDGTGLPL
ncbi:hypothetical protein AVEN_216883-1 [Araneus ventricosus]|uniref:Uncharacterized protein n=1 Tax=Araneus ventricosus TaxID=182803 RepID=A0A4Y2HT48_ARAVE|nr:hypothetical protein AVEN_216883-1 [Araneus ventricosus]